VSSHASTLSKPHWTTLATLVAAVLGLHLALLSSSISQTPSPRAEPDSLTQVRWIAPQLDPKINQPPEPARPAPAQRQASPPAQTQEPNAGNAPEPAQAPPPGENPPIDTTLVVAMASDAAPSAPPSAPPREQPLAAALPAATPPASAQLAYDVIGKASGLNYSARATLDWRLAAGQYSARMELRVPLLGSRVQTSVGRVEPSGLLPERFADKSRSERAAHFDHARQTIRFSNNRPEAPLQPGAQDRLSLFMQLAGLLRAQPAAYPAGRLISLQVAGTSDAETWRFLVGPTETLALPVGPMQALRLVRETREPHDSRVDIWLAPELAYLPVRIRITRDNGDEVDQQLSQMP
jgi:Protein of unknown function (DUF3108)